MSNVSFDEERTLAPAPQLNASQPFLTRVVISWGLAKDEKGAHMVLIGVVIVALVMAIAVPFLVREKEIPLREPVVPLPIGSYAR
ncbi:MAG: hypothetical protein Q8S35_01845 [bacterium]|nr:hypothetical protein [bacterium]